MKLVLGDWAIQDTEDSSGKYFLSKEFTVFSFNKVQKLTRNLAFSGFRWLTSFRDMTESRKHSINWMKFHNVVNITDGHMLKLIQKHRLRTIPVFSAYIPGEYEY